METARHPLYMPAMLALGLVVWCLGMMLAGGLVVLLLDGLQWLAQCWAL